MSISNGHSIAYYRMREYVTLDTIWSLCPSTVKFDELSSMLEEDPEFRDKLAKKYALQKNLHNGATLEFPENGYRNTNLLFWDNINQRILEPFTEIDDYGSVPPEFVVGDGYFNPDDWIDEVDHNSFVFPATPLINEMKEFAIENPEKNSMVVTINKIKYSVKYDKDEMKGNWDSCILEVDTYSKGYSFTVYPGDPEWRETIIDED